MRTFYRCLFLMFSQLSLAQTEPSVGNFTGLFTAGQDGSAIYHLDISVPATPSGLAPAPGLSFSSSRHEGLAGAGWDLTGLSSISRCNFNQYYNGRLGEVRFSRLDSLCLDGEPLVLVGGRRGYPGAEFRTSRETYTRITALGYGEVVEGFRVERKSGHTDTYGLLNEAVLKQDNGEQIPWQWARVKTEDSYGNYISYRYQTDQSTLYPVEMAWGANSNLNSEHSRFVRFQYGQRQSYNPGFVFGETSGIRRVLNEVTVHFQESLVWSYQLTHRDNGRELLTDSVKKCRADGTCLPPIEFTWDEQHTGFRETEILSSRFHHWEGFSPERSTRMMADVTGNGHSDIVGLYQGGVLVSEGRQGVFEAPERWDQTDDPVIRESFRLKRQVHVVDVTGNGLADILTIGRFAWLARGNGHSFEKSVVVSPVLEIPGAWITPAMIFAQDVTGNGFPDLVLVSNRKVFVMPNEKGSFGKAELWADDRNPDAGDPIEVFFADFYGSGRTDLIFRTMKGLFISRNQGESFAQSEALYLFHPGDPDSPRWTQETRYVITDLNGDGYPDILAVDYARVYLARGTGRELKPFKVVTDSKHLVSGGVTAADLSGNGRPDLIFYSQQGIWVAWNRGGSLSDPEQISDHLMAGPGLSVRNNPLQFADTRGTGQSDLVVFADDGVRVVRNKAQPVRLKEVRDGFGNTVSVSYAPLSDPSVYTKGHSAAFPEQDFQGALWVVSGVTTPDGAGGQTRVSYRYEGMRLHHQGAGGLGFARREVFNHTSGIRSIFRYSQDSDRHLQGLLLQTERISRDGVTLSQVSNDWDSLIHTRVPLHYEIRNLGSQTRNFDTSGTLTGTVTDQYRYDPFGNIIWQKTETSSRHGVWSKINKNTYEVHESSWDINRLVASEVLNQATDQPDILRKSAFEYDPVTGALSAEITEPGSPLAQKTLYERNPVGQVVKTTLSWDLKGRGLAFDALSSGTDYDEWGFVLRQRNSLGHTWQYETDPVWGEVIRSTDPDGLVTSAELDEWGRVYKVIWPDATSRTTSLRWCRMDCHPGDALYAVIIRQSGEGNTTLYMDQADRVLAEETVGFQGKVGLTSRGYNSQGLLAWETRPYFRGETSYLAQYHYDDLGRLTRVRRPDGSQEFFSYHGLSTTYTDPKGNRSLTEKNALGQKIRTVDAQGQEVRLYYNAVQKLVRSVDPDGTTARIEWDALGRKHRVHDPAKGLLQFRYNGMGLLWESSSPDGSLTRVSYDRLGRVISRSDRADTSEAETTTWTWDMAAHGTGQLASVAQDEYREDYSYDPLGRLHQRRTTIAGRAFEYVHSYDPLGRPETLSYPGGFAVKTHYGPQGIVEKLSSPDGEKLYHQNLEMDASGNVRSFRQGNQVVTSQDFDEKTGLPTGISSSSGGQQIRNLRYDFDEMGNLTARKNLLAATEEHFTYDSLQRLSSWTDHKGEAQSVRYDGNGNITFRSDVGTYRYGEACQGTDGPVPPPWAVTSIEGTGHNRFCYDQNGNMVSDSKRRIRYSSFNKPLEIRGEDSRTEFRYGPDRHRYFKKEFQGGQETTTLYIGGAFEEVTSGSRVIQKYYVGSGALVTREGGTEKEQWLHQDHLGSLQAVSDSEGKLSQSLSFDPWGKRVKVDAFSDLNLFVTEVTPRGFTGHEHLDSVGLIHMNGRIYDPDIGRFLSPDPFIQAPLSLQSHNRYSYVLNNPLSATDPSGYWGFHPFRAVRDAVSRAVKTVKERVGDLTRGVKEGLRSPAKLVQKQVQKARTWVKEHRKTVTSIAVMAMANSFIPGAGTALGSMVLGALSSAYTSNGNLQAIAVGALTAGAFYGLGTAFQASEGLMSSGSKVLSHGMVGGASSVAMGGDFESGFVGAAASQTLAQSGIYEAVGVTDNPAGFQEHAVNAVASAISGGVVADLSGGSFEHGAATAAFSRMFNDNLHSAASPPEEGIEGLGLDLGLIDGMMEYLDVPDALKMAVGVVGISRGKVPGRAIKKLGRLAGNSNSVDTNKIYSARELIRRAQDGAYHNFPESFNKEVFKGDKTVIKGYFKQSKPNLSHDTVRYTKRGELNGKTGTYEIFNRPSTSGNNEIIMHRFFKPDKGQ